MRYDLQGLSAVDLCLSSDPRHRSAHRHPFGDAGREVEARRYMEGGKPVGGCPQPPGWATDTTGHLPPQARRALVKRMVGAAEVRPFNVLSRSDISSTMPLQKSERHGVVKNECRLFWGVRGRWKAIAVAVGCGEGPCMIRLEDLRCGAMVSQIVASRTVEALPVAWILDQVISRDRGQHV